MNYLESNSCVSSDGQKLQESDGPKEGEVVWCKKATGEGSTIVY